MDGLVRNTKRRFWWDACLSFLAPERKTDKLLIEPYDYREKSIFQQIIDFDGNEKYTTALFFTCYRWRKTKNK